MLDDKFKRVLRAAQGAFGQTIIVNPIMSQPGAPVYLATGIWTRKAIEIVTEDGSYASTTQSFIGINLEDFVIPPKQQDQITTGGVLYDIIDVKVDGQGSADLWLRAAITR
jgi:hypothetical protein